MNDRDASTTLIVTVVVVVVTLILGLVGGCMYGWPKYRIWQRARAGEAQLMQAEYEKKIAVEEAKAKADAAVMEAEAEVARARGVAEANEIIGASLAGNDEYLRYLWIQGLQDGSSEVIYVPTEAQLPILEARDQRMPTN